jgi:broad specificity phosphatase PhoE
VSRLFLIRHAQASFGAADYDVLSTLGREQSEALGRFLAQWRFACDALYVGPRARHRDTAQHLCAAAAAAGLKLPTPIEVEELDEYPAFELFKYWLPKLANDPELAGGAADLARSPADAARILKDISTRWARGTLSADQLESFNSFVARIERGLDKIMQEQGRGKRVLAVTSGGPIGIAMRRALALSPDRTIEIAWEVINSSVSEFRFRGIAEFALANFNCTAHLSESRLVTMR